MVNASFLLFAGFYFLQLPYKAICPTFQVGAVALYKYIRYIHIFTHFFDGCKNLSIYAALRVFFESSSVDKNRGAFAVAAAAFSLKAII